MGLGLIFMAQAQQINPITKAMLNGYNEILKENPKDFATLYERAAQYYRISQYDNALNDLTKALEFTPEKEKDLRLSELTLLADAAVETGNYELALKAIDDALSIQPSNYANTYKKGNILLYLNQPQEAYRVFSSMQSMKSRSQEAYFGMAKANIMQNKIEEAEDLMKEAEKADPTNYVTYCRLGDLYLDMNRPENAATNYLIGYSLSDNSDRALTSLINLAEKNYDAVATALDFAIEKSDNKIPTLFLKGNIAEKSGNYSQAVAAFRQLLEFPQAQSAGVYLSMAKSQLGLNNLTEAKTNALKSLNYTKSEPAYTLLCDVALAEGNPGLALENAAKALEIEPASTFALQKKAEAQIALKDKEGALQTLNELIMMAPDDVEALLLRAYTNEILANNAKAALTDYSRIIVNDPSTPSGIAIQGIARAKSGKKIDADSTIENGLLKTPGDPDSLYWAAVYNAQTGNLEKAKQLTDEAIFAGFQNQYLLKSCDTPWLTLTPIRHLLK